MKQISKFLHIAIFSALIIFTAMSPVFSYQTGDTVLVGSYPFEVDGKKKDIEWIILEKNNDGTSLIISKYALDGSSFNRLGKYQKSWEKSIVRLWLNRDFYKKTFSENEKKGDLYITLPSINIREQSYNFVVL